MNLERGENELNLNNWKATPCGPNKTINKLLRRPDPLCGEHTPAATVSRTLHRSQEERKGPSSPFRSIRYPLSFSSSRCSRKGILIVLSARCYYY